MAAFGYIYNHQRQKTTADLKQSNVAKLIFLSYIHEINLEKDLGLEFCIVTNPHASKLPPGILVYYPARQIKCVIWLDDLEQSTVEKEIYTKVSKSSIENQSVFEIGVTLPLDQFILRLIDALQLPPEQVELNLQLREQGIIPAFLKIS